MNRTKLIQHYKAFFKLENMELSEDDHLIIDWAESLLEDTNVTAEAMRIAQHGFSTEFESDLDYEELKKAIGVIDIVNIAGKTVVVCGAKQHFPKQIPELTEAMRPEDKTTLIVEALPPLTEPTLYDCQRPNKRENKNKKGRNSHKFGRQPSKY